VKLGAKKRTRDMIRNKYKHRRLWYFITVNVKGMSKFPPQAVSTKTGEKRKRGKPPYPPLHKY
jgi:hypothetical protein